MTRTAEDPNDIDSVTPPDDGSVFHVSREKRDRRLNICKSCDRLFLPTRTCRMCGCFMSAKTWLHVSCPIGKW